MQAFLLVWGILQSLDLAWCSSCVQAQDYVCKEIPTRYPPGLSSVVLFVNSVGEINATVFNDINLASVTSLTMTKTGITTITPGAFDKFHNLRALNLHDNYISQVTSAWFSHKEVLEDLVLSNNSIEVLNDDSFRDLLGLLRLNLSQNQISNITVGSFRSLGKLRHLDLSNNRLRHLSVETLLPVNSTMLRLDGNLWDCSCAVYEFAIYLRELQRASLLENQMEVLCDHPVYQRGVPVWNVSKCETTTAVLGHTVANSHTLQPALTEEGTIDRSTLISLIVVLCALVLVICVLSVLYHRKQARKHLLVIRPSPETLERAKQAQTDCREVLENSKNVESAIANLKKNQQKCSRTVALLNQRVLEPEKVSQIYQIYSTGICQTRETSKRAKSAGPVLSRACPEVLSRRPDLEDQDGELEDQDGAGVSRMQHHCELHTSWAETEKEQMESGGDLYKDLRCEMAMSTDEEREWKRDEGKELAKTSEVENQHPQLDGVDNDDDDDDELDALKTGVKYKVNLIIGEGIMEGNILMENTKDQEFLHSGDEVNMCSEQELEDILTSRSARHQPHQEGSDDFLQPLEDAENMPYLTIGTDPRTKSPNQEQMPSETSPEQTPCRPFRPIRRVLTWPPTAAQWKKQWAQNQQILDIFPKLTFITERTHQNSLITANPENIPQGTGAGRLPVHKPAREEATVEMVEHPKGISESIIQSYIQNLSISSEDNVGINEAQIDVSSRLALNNEVRSELVSSNPLYKEMHSKADGEKSVNSTENSQTTKIVGEMTYQTHILKNEQSRCKSKRHLRRTEGEGRNLVKKGQNDHVQSSCGSAEPPAGGSLSEDNLLVDNEYAFIDLLHEVVENHGRWTRERWRQTHINKQKHKRFGKSY